VTDTWVHLWLVGAGNSPTEVLGNLLGNGVDSKNCSQKLKSKNTTRTCEQLPVWEQSGPGTGSRTSNLLRGLHRRELGQQKHRGKQLKVRNKHMHPHNGPLAPSPPPH
jgi:hypothetical protein